MNDKIAFGLFGVGCALLGAGIGGEVVLHKMQKKLDQSNKCIELFHEDYKILANKFKEFRQEHKNEEKKED